MHMKNRGFDPRHLKKYFNNRQMMKKCLFIMTYVAQTFRMSSRSIFNLLYFMLAPSWLHKIFLTPCL